MKKYKKTYFDYYKFGEQDRLFCEAENCMNEAVDIHHLIFKSHCGKDNIENLIGLCRTCHEKAHSLKEFNQTLIDKKEIEFLPFN